MLNSRPGTPLSDTTMSLETPTASTASLSDLCKPSQDVASSPPKLPSARRERISIMLSNLKGRQIIFSKWLITQPFVSSFVEDERRGTARKTRENTLLNRSQNVVEEKPRTALSFHRNSNRPPSRAALDKMDGLPKREISFSGLARVYTDLDQQPTLEQVKTCNQMPALETRMRSACSRVIRDPNSPTTTTGKWLARQCQKRKQV